jgi:hypothetical protein
MSDSLDFILLPLVRKAGKDRATMPGLYATDPPRRTARGRASDYLILHLALEGNAPLSSSGLNKLLESLAEAYYNTSGSSTAAMRRVAEGLNEYLLKRNLNAASRGLQGTGMLTLGVIRYEHIYMLQSGSGQVYLIRSDGVQHFHDPDAAGQGLGISRAPSFCYHQSPLSAGDVLLISPDPPLSWNTTMLRNFHGSPLGDLHRRLIRRAGSELNAAMMLVREGDGKMQLLRPQARRETESAPSKQKQPAPASVSAAASNRESPPEQKPTPARQEPIREREPAEQVEAQPAASEQESSSLAELWKSKIGPGLLAAGRWVKRLFGRIAQMVGTLFRRMLPDDADLSLPGSMMAFIAVAVPLIVVTVASVVYFQRGRLARHELYMNDARAAMAQARQYENPGQQREAWQTVLKFVQVAEQYHQTDESERTRAQARSELDELDQISRLKYRQALAEALPTDVEIVRIVTTLDGDVYLLDGVAGEVYRAVSTGDGYALKPEFECGPMPGPLVIGKLVDIAAIPPPSFDNAKVMGMDKDGNLIRCLPGGEAPVGFQMGVPDFNWGEAQHLSLDGGNLYVTDPVTNAVWVYDGREEYREMPTFFFGEDVPSMQTVVDLTVGDGKLYLLHESGTLTTSRFNGEEYQSPAMYKDSREGFEVGTTFQDAVFSELQYAPPPEPSVFMLDPGKHAIYQFSMQLTYRGQYRPQEALSDEPATAFAISADSDYRAFLAIGNQLYHALVR